jgi:hypothetical protein
MPSIIPDDPDTLLTRSQLVDALNHLGFKTTVATLATQASRGGGPPFELWGRKPLYRWCSSLAWAKSRLRAPCHSTSEAALMENQQNSPMSRRAAHAVASEVSDG